MKRKKLNLERGILTTLLWIFSLSLLAQNTTVSGRITDTNKEVLIGVTVLLKLAI